MEVCEHIAVMLNQIEAGAPWPHSALHARIVYLEKLGAELGLVMSYRHLTITAPIYRGWATMRLRELEPWVRSWALPGMFAGVPEMGAVDAWMEVLTMLEGYKLDGKHYCGGTADIAKFFDQIRRELVYKLLEASGMPRPVFNAYKSSQALWNPARLPFLHGGGSPAHETRVAPHANLHGYQMLYPC